MSETRPAAFRMIELVERVQAGVDRIAAIARRQNRLKELHASGDRKALRDLLESEFRADPRLMRVCLKALEARKLRGSE